MASDVEVWSSRPRTYDVIASRENRWSTRGLAAFRRGCALRWACHRPAPSSRVAGLGRWKLTDNLRARSCLPPATFAALVAGWLFPAQPADATRTAAGASGSAWRRCFMILIAVRDSRHLRQESGNTAPVFGYAYCLHLR